MILALALRLPVLRSQLGTVPYSMAKTATVNAAFLSTGSSQLLHVFIWVVQSCQDRRYPLFGFLEQMLEIQKNGLTLVLVDECSSDSCLATSACTSNPAHHKIGVVSQSTQESLTDLDFPACPRLSNN